MVLVAAGLFAMPPALAAPDPPANDQDTAEPPPQQFRMLAPAGFEDLLAPQLTVVDIHLDGARLGSAMAEFWPGHITFTDVGEVVGLIDGLTDPPRVRAALRGELPSNEDAICGTTRRGLCKTLRPKIATVVFDPDRLRVDLILHPSQRQRRRRPVAPFTQTPLTGLIGVDVFSASTLETGVRRGSVNVNALAGHGPHSLRLAAGLDLDTERVQLSAVEWQSHGAGTFTAMGALADTGASALRGLRYLGIRHGPVEDLQLLGDTATEQPITVLLPEPSRVDIMDNGRVLDVQYFDGGLASIDTASLPHGARTLTLRITDQNGEREESRFFARGGGLAPFGPPRVWGEGGWLFRQDTDGTSLLTEGVPDTGFGQARLEYRLRRDLGTRSFVFVSETETLFETELVVSRPTFNLRVSGLVSGAGDYGGRAVISARPGQGRGRRDRATPKRSAEGMPNRGRSGQAFWGQGFWGQGFWGQGILRNGTITLTLTEFVVQPTALTYPETTLPQSYGEARLNGSLRLGAGSLSVWVSARRTDDDTTQSWRAGYTGRLPFLPTRYGGSWTASVSGTNDQVYSRIGLTVPLGRRRAPNRHTQFTAEAQADNGTLRRPDTRAQLSARQRDMPVLDGLMTVDGRLGWDEDVRTYALGSQLDHDLFFLDTQVSSRRERATDVVIRGRSGMIFGPDVMIFEPRNVSAGAVVDVQGSAKGRTSDVMINQRKRGQVDVGRRAFIPLPALQSVDIAVLGSASAWSVEQSRASQLRLWPGAIGRVQARVDRVRTYFGRLVDEQGRPIVGASLTNGTGRVRTQEEGWFQADSADTTLVFTTRYDGDCTVTPLWDAQADPDIVDLKTVTCLAVAE